MALKTDFGFGIPPDPAMLQAMAAQINDLTAKLAAVEAPLAARAAIGAVGKGDLIINVKDSPYGADPTGTTTATSAFTAAFAAAVAAGGTVYTPAGTYLFNTQIVVPAGLKWILDPNAVLIKNFAGSPGDRYNNCLIRNQSSPNAATLVTNPGAWTPSTFDDDIHISGGADTSRRCHEDRRRCLFHGCSPHEAHRHGC
jgi:hypothetical protein